MSGSQQKVENLRNAAKVGDVAATRKLIAERTNVNAADSNGVTHLHLAAWNGHTEIVQLLLDGGANINATDKGGDTPLHDAARNGNVAVVSLLLARGARPYLINKKGWTPMMLAQDMGPKTLESFLLALPKLCSRCLSLQSADSSSASSSPISPPPAAPLPANDASPIPAVAFSSSSPEVSSSSVPKHLICPLTQEIMVDPVITANGQTYERAYIEKWFKRHATDPLTNTVVTNALIPNRALKDAIEEFKSQCAILKATQQSDADHEVAVKLWMEETQLKLGGKESSIPVDHTKATPTLSSSSSSSLSSEFPHFPWLAGQLSSFSRIRPADIANVVEVLEGEGIDCQEVLAGIAADRFTESYLDSIGIKKLGIQQHLLRIHKELRGCK